MPDDNFVFSCKIDEKCNRKFLDAKLAEEVEKLSKDMPEEPNKTSIQAEDKDDKQLKKERLSNIRDDVKSKKLSVKEAMGKLKLEELRHIDIDELEDPDKVFVPAQAPSIPQRALTRITEVNGSVIIRLG